MSHAQRMQNASALRVISIQPATGCDASPAWGVWLGTASRQNAKGSQPRTQSLYNPPVRILIAAGEASGEKYGPQLIEALRKLDPSIEFFAVDGERMRA